MLGSYYHLKHNAIGSCGLGVDNVRFPCPSRRHQSPLRPGVPRKQLNRTSVIHRVAKFQRRLSRSLELLDMPLRPAPRKPATYVCNFQWGRGRCLEPSLVYKPCCSTIKPKTIMQNVLPYEYSLLRFNKLSLR